MKTMEDTVHRRNDIVHRADRPQSEPGGGQQEITFAWIQQSVDAINHICLALDELIAGRMSELEAMLE